MTKIHENIFTFGTFLLGFFAGGGCEPTGPDTPLVIQRANTNELRITVTRIGKFRDDLAYDGERGIYLIVDTVTDQQFIGISGIGISELGSHYVDDQKHQNER